MLSAITKSNSTTSSFQTKPLTGIQRFYHRRRIDDHGASYYVEARELCPLDVLNTPDRFLVVTFDQADDYIVVADKRVYLTPANSIKCTSNIECRLAVVDLDELEHAKQYDFDAKFSHTYTNIFDSMDELRQIARDQYSRGGAVWIKQSALYDAKTDRCSYYYSTSYKPAGV
ncbi:hypothetical protein [Limosilactobacillus vaginalis]|uniref:hypothetical protein n=1 Tax=Limosilactobacillus vaginalis TaxID=1633 RepID=UPI00242FA17B|nr:hypothetical protein [Limosilactobacillus vaginalis]